LQLQSGLLTRTFAEDGKRVEINASKMSLDDLERSVFKHAKTLQTKEDGM
jgi:hypothetical protein